MNNYQRDGFMYQPARVTHPVSRFYYRPGTKSDIGAMLFHATVTLPVMIDPEHVDYHEIARRGDTEVMEMFLKAGLNPNLRDARG